MCRSSFADFVANDAADDGTAEGSGRATAGKNGTTDGTNAGADSGVLTLPRHAGTTTQADQHCCGNCAERESLHRFHGITSL
jgi:hypothetical protein